MIVLLATGNHCNTDQADIGELHLKIENEMDERTNDGYESSISRMAGTLLANYCLLVN